MTTNKHYSLKVNSKTYDLNLLSSDLFDVTLQSFGLTKEIVLEKVAVVDYHSQKIYVRSDVHSDLVAESVIHELLHVIIDESGISTVPTIPGIDLGEMIVAMMSPRLLTVMRDNSETLKDLCLK